MTVMGDQYDVPYVHGLLDEIKRLEEQLEAADRALRAIHFNASSWHAGEDGCRRALNVIQAWAAHPESVPEGVGEVSTPAMSPRQVELEAGKAGAFIPQDDA